MIKNYLDMYQKKSSQKVRSFYGTYQTRKWNDDVDIYYYEKKRGGKLFLAKCLEEAKEKGIVFNSSVISSSQKSLWIDCGWRECNQLYLYSQLFNNKVSTQENINVVDCLKLRENQFAKIVSIDKEIFDPYWRSSYLTLLDTLKSCRETLIYKYIDRGRFLAYALVGITMRSSFLQRFAVHPDSQGLGVGSLVLDRLIVDMTERKMISMKLNTQKENLAAQKLYEKKGFSLLNKSLSIMSSD